MSLSRCARAPCVVRVFEESVSLCFSLTKKYEFIVIFDGGYTELYFTFLRTRAHRQKAKIRAQIRERERKREKKEDESQSHLPNRGRAHAGDTVGSSKNPPKFRPAVATDAPSDGV